MKLKIIQIVDKGTHNSEKVLIDVLEDSNLKDYIIRDTTYIREKVVSNKWVHTYEFLKQPLKKGDKVVLYTKTGTNNEKDLGNGNKEYTYFWGLNSSVWNNDGDAAVLYEIRGWQVVAVNNK